MNRVDVRMVAARVGTLAWLTVVWVLLWGSAAPGTVAAGVLVAIGVTLALPLPRVPVEGRLHPLSTLRLVATVLGYLVTSSIQVAWLSIRPAPPPPSAVLRVPLRLRSDFCLALAVNALNLIPGGIVVRIDSHRRLVHVHVLDAGDDRAVESFRRQVATLERLFVRAFERPEDWRPSPMHDLAYDSDEEVPADEADGPATVGEDPR